MYLDSKRFLVYHIAISTERKELSMEALKQTITTLEIAEMMNMKHGSILRKLEGREINGKHINGVIDIINEHQMVSISSNQSATNVVRCFKSLIK